MKQPVEPVHNPINITLGRAALEYGWLTQEQALSLLNEATQKQASLLTIRK